MANYIVGDLQGELRPLESLLQSVGFDEKRDYLWATGDLVNRGSQSLEVLRYFYHHQHCTRTVLGNHDMHLMVVAAGIRTPSKGDTLDAILKAPDRDTLLDWLRQQPLIHIIDKYLLVHAGIPPQWDVQTARACAREVEVVLSGQNNQQLLESLYGDLPNQWDTHLRGNARLRLICNYLTRMRFCRPNGELALSAGGGMDQAPQGTRPWFAHPEHRCAEQCILFGHWAALRHNHPTNNIYALDGGWIWKKELRLLRLEDMQLFECEYGTYNITRRALEQPPINTIPPPQATTATSAQ